MNDMTQSLTVPHYHPVGHECTLFETAQTNGLPLLLKGPTGCGKTRFVEHMAAPRQGASYIRSPAMMICRRRT